ncbi:hypothetical protein [Actinobaculum sp. 313]|uniref:hypothetical protein n=1 Tax=Actinobaculum sp. 313 TaxID=2495645 RepID=UPI0013DE37C2|nr:hypothetical protein [Actinobaculum sp. 313]
MVAEQSDLRVPSRLLALCPRCGELMTTNLRADDTFVEDDGWHDAAARYRDFLQRHAEGRVMYLELSVGGNTPGIIKYAFWRSTAANPHATYVCKPWSGLHPAGDRRPRAAVDHRLGGTAEQPSWNRRIGGVPPPSASSTVVRIGVCRTGHAITLPVNPPEPLKALHEYRPIAGADRESRGSP